MCPIINVVDGEALGISTLSQSRSLHKLDAGLKYSATTEAGVPESRLDSSSPPQDFQHQRLGNPHHVMSLAVGGRPTYSMSTSAMTLRCTSTDWYAQNPRLRWSPMHNNPRNPPAYRTSLRGGPRISTVCLLHKTISQ